MKNPVPASDYNYNKGCKPPTDMWFASGSFCKKVTCVNGEFNAAQIDAVAGSGL